MGGTVSPDCRCAAGQIAGKNVVLRKEADGRLPANWLGPGERCRPISDRRDYAKFADCNDARPTAPGDMLIKINTGGIISKIISRASDSQFVHGGLAVGQKSHHRGQWRTQSGQSRQSPLAREYLYDEPLFT
jgi:hypothetical protein